MKLALTFFLFLASTLSAEMIPRKIIVPIDLETEKDLYYSRAHQMAEMPLNHLGLICHYVDIRMPLPDLSKQEDVRGIFLWLTTDTDLEEEVARRFMKWAVKSANEGKRVVMFGRPPFASDKFDMESEEIQEFISIFGLKYQEDWVTGTYDSILNKKKEKYLEFEESYPNILSNYFNMQQSSEDIEVLLSASGDEGESALITIGPKGSYAAGNYEVDYEVFNDRDKRYWLINPFYFFKDAFAIPQMPTPDTTTLSGRRIYYSHLDGDGWNNETELSEYPLGTISAQVLREKVLRRTRTCP